jgi:hypothetical protein
MISVNSGARRIAEGCQRFPESLCVLTSDAATNGLVK